MTDVDGLSLRIFEVLSTEKESVSLCAKVAIHCGKLHCTFCERRSARDVTTTCERSLLRSKQQFDGDAGKHSTSFCAPASHPPPLDYNLVLTSTCNKLELPSCSKL
jgi:hypothetical protein